MWPCPSAPHRQDEVKKADILKAARLRKRCNFAWFWVFLLGGPGETEETALETLHFIEEHVPRTDLVFVQIGVRLYPKTALHGRAIEEGVVTPDQSLLPPTWYLSDQVAPERLKVLISEHIARNPNTSTAKDAYNPLIPVFNRVAGALGMTGPTSTFAARALRALSTVGFR